MIARDTVCATREGIGQCSLMWRPMRSIADFQSRWVCLSFFHCRRNACLTRVYLIQITVNGCHNHHVNSTWDAIPNFDFYFWSRESFKSRVFRTIFGYRVSRVEIKTDSLLWKLIKDVSYRRNCYSSLNFQRIDSIDMFLRKMLLKKWHTFS